MKDTSKKSRSLCIIHTSKFAYSETFIHNHIQQLPAKVEVLYGERMLDGEMMVAHQKDGDKLLVPLALRVLSRWSAALRGHLKTSTSNKSTDSSKKLDWMSTFMLKRFLLSHGVDAVLSEYGPTGVAVMEACRKAQVPLVVHFHGFDAHRKSVVESYMSLYRSMFTHAGAIITVSRKMENQILKLGAPREKVHYNVYGVDIDQFKKARPDKNPPVFIAVGRFVKKKAPQLTLLAFKKVLDLYPSARLLMIGDGPMLEPCRQIVNAVGITHAVEFAGPKTHNEVAKAMQGARAFVQHSVTTSSGNSEGTPVVVLEAGASGLPVVSTRHAGIADVVVEDKTGFLVDEFDVDGMAQHMIRLVREPELALETGEKAREHITENFAMQKSIGNLWNIILKCISRNKG